MVGASSADIRLEGTCEITGSGRAVPEGRRLLSTVEVAPVD
jgi:hypothetical protein